MSEEKYYMISNSDGVTFINEYSKAIILKIINDEDYEKHHFIDNIGEENTNYWKFEDHLIIKGKIVVPKEKKVVVERDIE